MNTKLIACLQDAFAWMEQRDLRVGLVVLHPEEARQLRDWHDGFDVNASPELENIHGFGRYVGVLLGAHVVEYDQVVPGHIGIFPDGATVIGVDSSACFSLGLNADPAVEPGRFR